jgi:formylglycine-generating enzyme required for sulfatase activity/tRNA A-37 threonylcarbamoyl transferase component Bud32
MERIGRYEITAEIGRGGMGVVYRARDTELGRTVAIKTLHLSEYATPQEVRSLRERLLREARAAGNLNHPNLVAVHDFGQENDTAYIVMELVEGRTLQDLVAESAPITRETSLRILSEAAAALDYAHACGAVHRDVKPANIMVRTDGAVKIADFGIAKLACTKTITETGMIVGSPHYMAPEQLKGDPVSSRTDQFGLAGVAYTLLTGRRPFDADTVASLFHRVLNEDPIPVQVLTPGVGVEVDRVLRKAMAKNPADRFSNCSAFVDALKSAWLDAHQPEKVEVPQPRLPVSWIVAAALILLVLAGAFFMMRYQAARSETAYWDSIKDRREPALFAEHLRKYPKGRFAAEAKRSIEALERAATANTKGTRTEEIAAVKSSPQASKVPPAREGTVSVRDSGVKEIPEKKTPRSGPTISAMGDGPVGMNPMDGLPYSWIPPGSFQMGCSPDDDSCDYPEKPPHTVTITKGFWMGQTEVTLDAYQRFAKETGRKLTPVQRSLEGENHPMVLTSWDDATAFCSWAGGRLPSEAEWEYGARAGTAGPFYGNPDEIAWHDTNGEYRTHPVRQLAPNPFRLYDMLGNVWERVTDWYDEDYYGTSKAKDPTGPSKGRIGVVRGGSYSSRLSVLRVSYRGMKGREPGDVAIDIGFRCVRESIP